MGTIARGILLIALMGGLSQCDLKAGELEVGLSAGVVDSIGVAGAYIKKNKYTIDAHVGVEENKEAISVGLYRELVNLSSIGLKIGVGLSTNKSEILDNNLIKTRTYQGYDVDLNYDIGKVKLRTTINSNGDIKAGVGFSF